MRRVFLLVAVATVVAAVLAFPGLAGAKQKKAQDKVKGGGSVEFGKLNFKGVRSDPLGDDPTGRVKFKETGFVNVSVEGRVTCLNVAGNRATVGGEITKSSDPTLVGRGFVSLAEDNGSPKGGTPDRADYNVLPEGEPPPLTCTEPEEPPFELEQGNLTVSDATVTEP